MKWLLVAAVLLSGCVEYGALQVEEVSLQLRSDRARLWVDDVAGRPDWSALRLRVEACADRSFDTVLHVGNAYGAVNRGADGSGKALNRVPSSKPCGAPEHLRVESKRHEVRYGDFLEFCTTPQGRDGSLHGALVAVEDPFGAVLARTILHDTVPPCRR